MWLLFILLSAILLAAWILLMRRDIMHEPNTQVIAIYPMMAVILLPLFAPIDYGVIFTKTGFLLLVKTASVAISIFCTSMALKKLPLTIIGPLRNINPLFVWLLGFLLLGESLNAINALGLILIVLGVILLDFDIRHPKNLVEFKKHFKNKATLLLLIGALAVSFSPIFDRVLIKQTDVFTIMFYFSLILSFTYWIVHFIQEKKLPIRDLSLHEFLFLLLTGLTIMMADIFYFVAASYSAIAIVVIIGVRRLSNLFVTIFGGAVLHEKNALYKAMMCSIMVIGTVLLVL